jgi:hypothetical protein
MCEPRRDLQGRLAPEYIDGGGAVTPRMSGNADAQRVGGHNDCWTGKRTDKIHFPF